jgi:hypothetical protein
MNLKSQSEELVSFAPGEDRRYREQVEMRRLVRSAANESPSTVSSRYRLWPHLVGRGKYGEFPMVVVGEHYRAQGYTVWFCEPALDRYEDSDFVGFMLLSYPGRRRAANPAYVRMQEKFGKATVEKLNVEADRAKLKRWGRRGGGDPDLFVFKERERFFVEVKWKDRIREKQCITFPLIERHCGVKVKIVRIVERQTLTVRRKRRTAE